jgi:hypothetical protein
VTANPNTSGRETCWPHDVTGARATGIAMTQKIANRLGGLFGRLFLHEVPGVRKLNHLCFSERLPPPLETLKREGGILHTPEQQRRDVRDPISLAP